MSQHSLKAISAYTHHRCTWSHTRLVHLFVVSCLFMISACASRGSKAPLPQLGTAFPEVTGITFRGNSHFGSRALRKAMATRARPLWPFWRAGERYNAPTLDEDLRRLQKYYFDRGFLEAEAHVAEIQKDEEQNTVRLVIAIDEGAATTVKAVHILGTIPPEVATTKHGLTRLPLGPGDRLTKEGFEQTKKHLLGLMQAVGYARAQVIPDTDVDLKRHEAILAFTLQPGALTMLGRIRIKGTREVRKKTVRRRVDIQSGDNYNPRQLAKTQERIYDLGMFRAVTPRGVNFDQESGPLDIDLEVQERKPRTVEIGLGFSTVSRFRLQVEWLHRSLFHGAERLSLFGKLTSIEQSAEITLHLPYFLGRRTTFTQTGFVRNEQEIGTDPLGISDALFDIKKAQPAFDLLSIGGETRVDHRLFPHLRWSFGLELSLNEVRNVDEDALADEEDEIAEDNILLVQFTQLQWDTSNDALNPTSGVLLSGRFEHSNTDVISDVNFFKFIFEARHYLPLLWRIVLATRVKLGSIEPYGISDDVPFNVRFFAGGPGSIRGFAINRVGPRDDNDDPIGGRSLFEAGGELRFPIFRNVGGAVFVDAGNVFRDPFVYRVTQMRYAVGPGLRYRSPVGVIRLDVGFIMDRRSDEDFARVEFSIGQAF